MGLFRLVHSLVILGFVACGCRSQGAGPRGSIAAKTGVNITKLEELNPQVKPTTLHPGDRARLRPELKVGPNCGLNSKLTGWRSARGEQ